MLLLITIKVNKLYNVVVKNNHVASFGDKLKIRLSDCPSIWLIFELAMDPAVSPTPNTLRTLSRLCKSPQLLFLKKKDN